MLRSLYVNSLQLSDEVYSGLVREAAKAGRTMEQELEYTIKFIYGGNDDGLKKESRTEEEKESFAPEQKAAQGQPR